jgi:phage tail tape-measure protein
MQTGQIAEGYQDVAMQDAVNRFNFAQQAPYQKLQSYLAGAYGSPMGTQGSVTTSGGGRSKAAGALGGAAAGAAMGAPAGPWGAAIGAGVGALSSLL